MFAKYGCRSWQLLNILVSTPPPAHSGVANADSSVEVWKLGLGINYFAYKSSTNQQVGKHSNPQFKASKLSASSTGWILQMEAQWCWMQIVGLFQSFLLASSRQKKLFTYVQGSNTNVHFICQMGTKLQSEDLLLVAGASWDMLRCYNQMNSFYPLESSYLETLLISTSFMNSIRHPWAIRTTHMV